jgi:hypothetical protein
MIQVQHEAFFRPEFQRQDILHILPASAAAYLSLIGVFVI